MINSDKKRILVIAFGFPPRAGSGIQRIVRYVSHLPENGWEPIVLTVSRWGNDIEDAEWEKQLPPGLKIFRVFSLDPFRFAQLLRKKTAGSPAANSANASSERNGRRGIISRFSELFHAVSIPDHAVWWIPGAVIVGLFLTIRYRPKILFSTSGPYGAALAGLILHKLTGLRWAAEFRDPWAANLIRKQTGLRGKIETSQERACLRNASAVIATTDATRDEYRSRTPNGGCRRFETITNGFHPPDFDGFPQKPANDKMTVVYTGMFYGKHTPDYFFAGIEKACALKPELTENVRMIFAGSMPRSSRQLAQEPPIDKMITLLPYISHSEVLKLLTSADMLYLALAAEQGAIYPGKLYEYLAARRFIFATVPPGVCADTLKRFDAGFIAEPQDIDSIAVKFIDAYELYRRGELKVKHSFEDTMEFSWPALTKKLADIFSNIQDGKI